MTCGKLDKGGCDNPDLTHYGPCLNLTNWSIPIAICRDWTPTRATKVYRVDLRGGKFSSGYGPDVFIYVGTDTTSPAYAFRHAVDKPERTRYFLANSAAQVRKFITEHPSIWPEVKTIHNTAGRNRDRATWREIFQTYERFDKIEFIRDFGWGDVPRRITSEDIARGLRPMPKVGDNFVLDIKTDTYTITPKESTMTTSSRAEALRRQAEEILIEADRLDSRPNEPIPEEEGEIAVISWNMVFADGGTRTYNYAAIRTAQGRWSTTGPRSPKDYSWEDLIEWIFRNSADGEDTDIWICTEFGLLG